MLHHLPPRFSTASLLLSPQSLAQVFTSGLSLGRGLLGHPHHQWPRDLLCVAMSPSKPRAPSASVTGVQAPRAVLLKYNENEIAPTSHKSVFSFAIPCLEHIKNAFLLELRDNFINCTTSCSPLLFLFLGFFRFLFFCLSNKIIFIDIFLYLPPLFLELS